MAISRERKNELINEYGEQLERSQGVILAHYRALSVEQMQELRQQARDNEGRVYVVKNTLFHRVLKDRDLAHPEDLLTGPTLVAFCHEDTPPLAKVFKEFAKELEAGEFTLRGAFVDNEFYSAEQAEALAELPTRDQLFGQVLGTINAPATQLVGVVSGGIRQVLNVLQAYVDKLEEEGGAPAEATA